MKSNFHIAVHQKLIVDCHEKHLGSNDMLNSDLLMLDEVTLQKLILSRNNIVDLPGHLLKRLKHLKSLDLSENVMSEIHTDIFMNLYNLEDLSLSRNNLTSFDDLLLKVLPTLLTLDLSHNRISTIEHTIDRTLMKINSLNLAHNSIINISENFFESLSNLQYLDLSFNKIYSLENVNLIHLNSLKILYINNNFLTSIYMQILPKSLTELHAGYNLITEVYYEQSQMEVLSLEFNQISEIKSNLSKLENLQHLNITGNKISNFTNVVLQNLRILDISYNKLFYIPETVSVKNFPVLIQLNISQNPIQNLTFPADLKFHSFVASNMSMLSTIAKDTFAKLVPPSNVCINLTLSNNEKLSSIHEDALDRLNLCSLDLSNNQLSYIAQKLVLRNTSFTMYKVNLQGNPFKCNCSLQWMLDTMVPKLYSTYPNLLDELRCAWPLQISNMRMVHWYGWKGQVFCTDMSDFNEKLTINVAGVIPDNQVVKFDSSPGLLAVLGTTICVLSILVIVGLIWTQRLYMKRRRVNRKF
ncbi:Carboxypeptidase N subunit 2 [Dufourea novaeangliae]|uniref:Carboxypeptidase N subunit 2 n=1 Tax=Dufourea novaeangliae TaxID=178035 RepID=A0A154P130_DUFNO|nr:Carboxypeptidase N subunit 2 [Dufourea novaeangliae]